MVCIVEKYVERDTYQIKYLISKYNGTPRLFELNVRECSIERTLAGSIYLFKPELLLYERKITDRGEN